MKTKTYEEFVNESEEVNEKYYAGQIKSDVETAVDGLNRKIKFTLNSDKTPQEMSDIFDSVTFVMGQLLDQYSDYIRFVQSDDDDTSAKRNVAQKAIENTLKKIKKDVRGRFN